jgi:hypothetical protein
MYYTVHQQCNKLFLISFTFTFDTCSALNGYYQVSYYAKTATLH